MAKGSHLCFAVFQRAETQDNEDDPQEPAPLGA